MIRAYSEIYLDRAMQMMGEMFDYAIHDCRIPGEEFVARFTTSAISRRIENGEPALLVGKSGIEVALEVLGGQQELADSSYDRTPAFWIGWAVCYYQWFCGHTFSDIFTAIPYSEMMNLYPALHEADLSKTAAVFDKRYHAFFKETTLKRIRCSVGFSQRELSEKSGVSLRSIQMYEQRNKDINKAQAITLYRLSKALGCKTEDLLEL